MQLNLDDLIERQLDALAPSEAEFRQLINQAIPVFDAEPNIIEINDRELLICGDSHGQLYDVKYLFQITRGVEKFSFLFLGDYVDRGDYSVELLALLLCLKLKYKERMFLLRGNHETRAVNRDYGFYRDLVSRYDASADELWELCNRLFDFMPLAAIVDKRLFCVHGGLSPLMKSLEDVRTCERRVEPEIESMMAHLLWSDPGSVDTWRRTQRRTGYFFGENLITEFLEREGLKMIVRAHEQVDGYKIQFNSKIVTVWAAPNYAYSCTNKAGFMKVVPGKPDEFVEYGAMPEIHRKRRSSIR